MARPFPYPEYFRCLDKRCSRPRGRLAAGPPAGGFTPPAYLGRKELTMTNSASTGRAIELSVLLELSLGQPVGQCRAVPVNLGEGAPPAVLAVYAADFDVDPWVE